MSSTEPEFWNERYEAGRIPWDLRGVPPALTRFLEREAAPGRVLIPGCGSGYEVKAFLDRGWQPVALDFSPVALERARTVLGAQGGCLRLADFFRDDPAGPFDLIYERTFLCSMPPERRPAYAARMAGLLRPGDRLAGVFAYGIEPEPPPYPMLEAEAQALLSGAFERVFDIPIPAGESPPLFAGMERWQVWRRR